MDAYTVSVSNLQTRGGNPAANQYVISDGRYYVYQSYTSTIAVYNRFTNNLTLGDRYDFSRTTLRYLRKFLETFAAEFLAELPTGKSFRATLSDAIDSGEIQFDVNMV